MTERKAEAVFPATSMPDRTWWAALWPHPEDVMRSVGIEPGMWVLDLCCGDGTFTAPLAKLVHGKVIGLDIDCAMLEQAKTAVSLGGGSVQRWICADAMSVAAHVTEPVDFVLIANTFHGVPDQRGLARAVRSVLRPGGHFAIINWHPARREDTVVLGKPRGPRSEMRMPPAAVAAVVEPSGFQLSRVVELPPHHYASIFRAVAPRGGPTAA